MMAGEDDTEQYTMPKKVAVMDARYVAKDADDTEQDICMPKKVFFSDIRDAKADAVFSWNPLGLEPEEAAVPRAVAVPPGLGFDDGEGPPWDPLDQNQKALKAELSWDPLGMSAALGSDLLEAALCPGKTSDPDDIREGSDGYSGWSRSTTDGLDTESQSEDALASEIATILGMIQAGQCSAAWAADFLTSGTTLPTAPTAPRAARGRGRGSSIQGHGRHGQQHAVGNFCPWCGVVRIAHHNFCPQCGVMFPEFGY
eukprot:gb/GFBE01047558.1/.p1 GENE.gb/GFBE01047558.1/~~gb/GFBE01047558.1/.p1  ORF type:complete len:256 (+),score=43.40 gb/GFBE01047558.1/:1-768(+)